MHSRLALSFLLCATAVSAQEFRFESELRIDLATENVRRGGGLLSVSPTGRMIFLPEYYRSAFRAFDTTGKDLQWDLRVGRTNDADIGWVRRLGWIGRTDSMWVEDQMYGQVLVVDPAGKVQRGVEEPSWVRPRWAERRRYPLFTDMEWVGVYSDGTMLVLPRRPRALFDTPQYDRAMQHLLRVDADGIIRGTVARVPVVEGRLQFRDGTQRRWQRVDFFPRHYWKASPDGQRVAVVTQSRTDSGAFRAVMLDANGDTVFARDYTATATRIPPERKAEALRGIQPFGKFTADMIRDSVRRRMADFEPPVVELSVGVDHSLWIWLRDPGGPATEWVAMILDPTGAKVGYARLPRSFRTAEVAVDRAWTLTRGDRTQLWIERFRRVPATAARPSRSARTSAPSR